MAAPSAGRDQKMRTLLSMAIPNSDPIPVELLSATKQMLYANAVWGFHWYAVYRDQGMCPANERPR